jgi:hypothetical protein
MKTLTAVALAAFLAGCASIPQPNQPAIHHKAPVAKQVVKPVEQPAPQPTFKQRWFDRFKKHPKFFH